MGRTVVAESIGHLRLEQQAKQMIDIVNQRRDVAAAARCQFGPAAKGPSCSFEGAAAFSSGQLNGGERALEPAEKREDEEKEGQLRLEEPKIDLG